MSKNSSYCNNAGEICWIDSHCHLCNDPLKETYREEISQAGEDNIRLFISTALNRREIDWHLNNCTPEIKLVAGIHPYYEKSNQKDFDYLVEQCRNKRLWGIGEVGFDKRKNNHNYQKTILYQQLQLAEDFGLPVVFHVVGRYNELYQTLKNDFPGIKGFIHGFYGSVELVDMFSRLDVGFSIGYKMLQKKDSSEVIKRIVKRGLVLFETDAPFQKLDGSDSRTEGHLDGLTVLIDRITRECSLHMYDLFDKQWQTYNYLTN